jgi:hypothetical protein
LFKSFLGELLAFDGELLPFASCFFTEIHASDVILVWRFQSPVSL